MLVMLMPDTRTMLRVAAADAITLLKANVLDVSSDRLVLVTRFTISLAADLDFAEARGGSEGFGVFGGLLMLRFDGCGSTSLNMRFVCKGSFSLVNQ